MAKLNGLSIQLLVSRVLISLIFIIGTLWKMTHHEMLCASMNLHHVPFVSVFSYCSVLIELICGFGMLLGIKTKYAAYLCFFYMVIITWFYHIAPMSQVDILSITFSLLIKNLAIMGGLLSLASAGGGEYSLDYMLANKSLRPLKMTIPVS